MQPARPAVPLDFPVGGLDVSTAFEAQPPQSTPQAANVRGYEPATQRLKGGARPGLAKFVTPQLPSGSHLIQCLDTVVWASTAALLDADATLDSAGTTDGTADPSTGSRNPGRTVRTGGSGRQPNRNAGNSKTLKFVQKKSATVTSAGANAGPTFTVSLTNATPAGSLLLATGSITGNLEIGNVADSLGNTWHPLFPLGGGLAKLWWAVNAVAGFCTITYDLGSGGLTTSSTTGVLLEYSGNSASPLDGSSQHSDFLNSAVTWTTGNVTALGSKELLIGVFVTFYSPVGLGDFTPGVNQTTGPHNSYTLRSEDLVTDPHFANEYYAVRVIELIGTGTAPAASQEITATGSDPGGGNSYDAAGASFLKG